VESSTKLFSDVDTTAMFQFQYLYHGTIFLKFTNKIWNIN